MPTYMLVDASHPEETRVAMVEDGRVQDYDFVTSTKKQIKGNLYLAKVTRVEPSLQAAFVEYGGGRQGFLPFAEIHPDYYNIPLSDKEEMRRQAEARRKEAAGREEEGEESTPESAENTTEETAAEDEEADSADVEVVSGEEDEEDIKNDAASLDFHKRYHIQEVIKRNQILLVQVIKEERGTKGAAVTTFVTLAGRYCVLMPNTISTGGISRKIRGHDDRKRLRKIVSELEVEEGMSVIVRTAGSDRTRTEIKRDFEYLRRLWNEIRETTLSSSAPSLVYEESDLIKRSIRDLYNSSVDAVWVAGEEGYKAAKHFMKMLMPSHAARVKQYRDTVPLFHEYKIEDQLQSMHDPVVQLRSGGYLVINPTEALVSIDVNSGRSTREHSIEETAIKTNTEAAREVARQLRLRDLAGLIVIDFIDMMEGRNRRAVERTLKEALRNDRAKIQVGRISPFGLLEMSRQRLRPSITEVNALPCPHCAGAGIVRSAESFALQLLRDIEKEAFSGKYNAFEISASPDIALYALNSKRDALFEIEQKYGISITITTDGSMAPKGFMLRKLRGEPGKPVSTEEVKEEETSSSGYIAEEEGDTEEKRPRRRRGGRRRGGRNRRRREEGDNPASEDTQAESQTTSDDDFSSDTPEQSEDGDKEPRSRSRRGGRRRGGRRRGGQNTESENNQNDVASADASSPQVDEPAGEKDASKATAKEEKPATAESGDSANDEKPKTRSSRRRSPISRKKADSDDKESKQAVAEKDNTPAAPEPAAKRKATPKATDKAESEATEPATQKKKPSRPAQKRELEEVGGEGPKTAANDTGGGENRRNGWWRRLLDQ